jgi:hypothetical protein
MKHCLPVLMGLGWNVLLDLARTLMLASLLQAAQAATFEHTEGMCAMVDVLPLVPRFPAVAALWIVLPAGGHLEAAQVGE